MDAIQHLVDEHRKAEELMARLRQSSGDGRADTLDELQHALETHIAIEERFVYPLVREHIGEEEFNGAETEHALAQDGLVQLRALLGQPGFEAALAMLEAGVRHHVEEEEQEIFPALRARCSDELDRLPDPETMESKVSTS
jgi:hemerythrin-like domain-containing protein